MNQRDDTNKQTQPAGRLRRTRKDNHVTFLNLYIDITFLIIFLCEKHTQHLTTFQILWEKYS